LPIYYRTLHCSRKDFIPSHNRGIPIAQEPKTIGEHLRRRRCELRLTQFQAARRLQVSTVTLSRWERDHTYPTWDYHASIIEYLGYDAFKQTGLRDPYRNESNGVAFFADGPEEEIGQRIRQRRLELKLTLGECAQKLGVDIKTVFNWERGKHRPLKSMEERIKSFLEGT
jgi:transcriptional regulator with XRE-family HTH domain